MQVPDISHPAWRKLITREVQVDLSFMAAKMLLMRLSANVGSSSDGMYKAVDELHNLYAKNSDLPNVQKDLEKIVAR